MLPLEHVIGREHLLWRNHNAGGALALAAIHRDKAGCGRCNRIGHLI